VNEKIGFLKEFRKRRKQCNGGIGKMYLEVEEKKRKMGTKIIRFKAELKQL